MENGGGVGLWLAYGVIGLFLLVLTAVIVRTTVLYGSLVLMALLSLLSRGRFGAAHAAPPSADPMAGDGRVATAPD